MAEETIFSKIIRKEIPSDIVYQDDLVTAFRDITPTCSSSHFDHP
ncbi:YcfF/hinT protein: a purine nucleoside phosphoramidase [Vibrio astriarenae]|nr:YcfF/hinT protein: a purine nucleoside phosphoramidase [Vibrio sp. C7]